MSIKNQTAKLKQLTEKNSELLKTTATELQFMLAQARDSGFEGDVAIHLTAKTTVEKDEDSVIKGVACVTDDQTGFDSINMGVKLFKDMLTEIEPESDNVDEGTAIALIKKIKSNNITPEYLIRTIEHMEYMSALLASALELAIGDRFNDVTH